MLCKFAQMEKLLTHNPGALRFLMTEDLYNVGDAFSSIVPGPAIVEMITDRPEKTEEPEQSISFNYLGENNRYFLIIVDDNTHHQLNAAHKDMLMKIMAAKKLELRDLAILNLANYPGANFGQLKDFFSCNKIALFGIDPQKIGLPAIPSNQPGKHQEVKILATVSLGEMNSSTGKKREFWNVMKDF